MRTFLFPIGRKTWDGWRWMFVAFAVVSGALSAYLAFALSGTALFLAGIPAGFCLLFLGVALVATDDGLQKVVNFLMAANV